MKYFPEKLTIHWLKQKYEAGELTPLEVAEHIVEKTAEYEAYHIWIQKPDFEKIKGYVERLPKEPKTLPLWGIPFAIKDNIDLEGEPTTAACPEYAYTAEESATVVEKLIQAGAIPVGKTNLDQFATGLVGTRSPYGEVHNALNPELISGGSSSGSAVAVALGMAAFSLGTDTAGSGRVPAMLNNLVGYKPPVGAWSAKGVVPACASLDCVTVFANNLEDAMLVNEQARGVDYAYSYTREFKSPAARLPKKICLAKNGAEFFGPYKDVMEEKWKRAVERLKRSGVEIEYIDDTMFKKAASILYDGPWVAERWKDLHAFVDANPGKTFPVTETILRSGGKPEHTAVSMFEALHELQAYKVQTKQLLKDAVLILPTAGGTFTREQVRKEPIATNSQMGLYTNHCNLLDLCAVAVPENRRDKNLPFGITIFTLAEREDLLLGMAEKFLQMETMTLAVCGLHKKGYPFEYQLVEKGAYYRETTKTAAKYKLCKLPTKPVKPGLYEVAENGANIEVDLYEVPIGNMGDFLTQVPKPLTIGTVMLEDGRMVKGFLCEEYSAKQGIDMTEQGKW